MKDTTIESRLDEAEFENRILKEYVNIHSVSKEVAEGYAEFCVTCYKDGLPLLCLEDYIEKFITTEVKFNL